MHIFHAIAIIDCSYVYMEAISNYTYFVEHNTSLFEIELRLCVYFTYQNKKY
jgi:hypothetical protein